MQLIHCFFTGSVAFGEHNPYLSSELTVFDAQGIPGGFFELSSTRDTFAVPLTHHLPIKVHSRPLRADLIGQYGEDYYHRIHIFPGLIELGNLVGTQTRDVFVWNATFTQQTLVSAHADDPGMSLLPPSALPLVMPPLSENLWGLSVIPDGPSVIEATLSFYFEALLAPHVLVTGNRVVPWGFLPDWSSPVQEKLEFLTGITTSPSGAEQRRAWRTLPQRGFEARFIVAKEERSLLDLALAGWGYRTFVIPIWPDGQTLETLSAQGVSEIVCQTVGFDFSANGLAFVRAPGNTSPLDWLCVEVEVVLAQKIRLKRPLPISFPKGTRLYPARPARLTKMPELTRINDELATTTAEFLLIDPCAWPAALPLETYRGRPLFLKRPDESENLTSSVERLIKTLDNTISVPKITDISGRAFSIIKQRTLLAGRAEHSQWRSQVMALLGRQQSLWLPTHASDMTLAKKATSTIFPIRRIGFALFGLCAQGRRDIFVEFNDGRTLALRIVAASEEGELELLSLARPLAFDILPEDVARISFLVLVRQLADEQVLRHITDADGYAQAETTWRGVRDDLECLA